MTDPIFDFTLNVTKVDALVRELDSKWSFDPKINMYVMKSRDGWRTIGENFL
jgi:hypothetical protein